MGKFDKIVMFCGVKKTIDLLKNNTKDNSKIFKKILEEELPMYLDARQ